MTRRVPRVHPLHWGPRAPTSSCSSSCRPGSSQRPQMQQTLSSLVLSLLQKSPLSETGFCLWCEAFPGCYSHTYLLPRNNQPGAWHLVFVKSLQLLVPETYHTSQHLISGWAEGLGFATRWRLPGGQTTLFMDGAQLVGTGGAALFHCFWTSQGPHLLELLHTVLGLFRECECSSKILLLVLVFAKSSNQPFPSRGWGEQYCTLGKRGGRFLCVFSSRQGTR